jgi:hypothetical protein
VLANHPIGIHLKIKIANSLPVIDTWMALYHLTLLRLCLLHVRPCFEKAVDDGQA